MSTIEIIARGVCIRGAQVLVCRNLSAGYCFLPGGHVEFGESARSALAREFLEEAGARVKVGRCVLVTEGTFESKRTHHEMNVVFLVESGNDEVRSIEPQIAFEWLDLASLVDEDFRPMGIKAWLMAGGPFPRMEWVSEIPD